jgi:hypothetical protein
VKNRFEAFAFKCDLYRCTQGLLGGFAALNLFMTYLLDAPNLPNGSADSGFLKYYSPIAVSCQRTAGLHNFNPVDPWLESARF